MIARPGLNLRAGPGNTFPVLETIPNGTIVTELGLQGSWMKVDLHGDGHADGFMFKDFLEAVSGGLPLPFAPSAPGAVQRPIDVARAEMALNVAEIPGAQDNPRIVLYHSTTVGGAASDETAWCSSFINYCVDKAGFRGTDSKAALSWADWGQDVTRDSAEGDIAVFCRRAGSASGEIVGGHVAFMTGPDQGAPTLSLLGGNQSQRVCIQSYPRNGVLGSFHYLLLSIRRP